MATGVHRITEEFEGVLSKYTGAPYVVALDNCSNAIFLSLVYQDIRGKTVKIPNRTYPSVPCEIIHAGGIVEFYDIQSETLKGAYFLQGTKTVDSSLRFTYLMYHSFVGRFVCLSFTGPYKHLKLGKGGAILTDDFNAFTWFKRARYSGRREQSYLDDNLDMLGWNFYMMPEIAAKGLLLMNQFYDAMGVPKSNEDIELPYPDLSMFRIYQTGGML